MTDTPKRAVIWKAVSSKEQAEDDRQSLPYQEGLARDWCQKNGYEVTTLLELPGHSRSESDVITALEELAEAGCYAYHDLRRMWQQKSFDILIVHTIDRLARSRSLFMWTVENVIKSGADIYFLTPGVKFDKGNVDYTAPMALMGLRSALDAFFEKSRATKMAKLTKGIPTSGKKPFGYIVEYDDHHRLCGVHVDPDPKIRALLDDAAALLLGDVPGAGHVSLRKIEIELFERFGHNRNGKPYPVRFIHNILSNPWTWGHASHNHNNADIPGGQSSNGWLFDDTIPVPEHVVIHWNVLDEYLFPPEVAARLKEELRLRQMVVRGRGTAQSSMFASLVLCGYCGYTMIRNRAQTRAHPRWRCQTNDRRNRPAPCRPVTRKNEGIVEWQLRDYFQGLLNDMLANDTPVLNTDSQPDYPGQLNRVRVEIETLRGEVMNLIARSASSSKTIGDLFQAQIDERSTRLEALEIQQGRLEAKLATQHPRSQSEAFNFLKAHASDFWTLPAPTINRLLHALLGNIRVVVKDGKVFGRTTV